MPPVIRDSEEEEPFSEDNSVGEFEEDETAKQYSLKYANDSELSVSEDENEHDVDGGASSDVPDTSRIKYDDTEGDLDEEDEEDEEEEDEEEEDEEELEESEEEADNYKLEDPDEDMDEDLELRDDDEDDIKSSPKKEAPKKAPTLKLKLSKPPANEVRHAPVRETRKRQLGFYDEGDDDDDDDDDDEEEGQLSKPRTKKLRIPEKQLQPTDLDADLILTDEETEYNPHANPDLSKMTERQRARYLEEAESGDKKFVELGDKTAKKPKSTKLQETEEQAKLRKAESARRRLDYKNKLMEEEKRDTLNKLLKRRAAKTREVQTNDGGNDGAKLIDKPRRAEFHHPALLSWRNTETGSLLGLPELKP